MTLTVYIIGKHSELHLAMLRTRLSFVNELHFIHCKDYSDVNDRIKDTAWYLVLHEGEMLDFKLTIAVLKIVSYGGAGSSIFNFFKKNDTKYSITPRLFKSYIRLRENELLPEARAVLVATNILDGWVYDL